MDVSVCQWMDILKQYHYFYGRFRAWTVPIVERKFRFCVVIAKYKRVFVGHSTDISDGPIREGPFTDYPNRK